MMEQYEKPNMEIIPLAQDIAASEYSCEGTYPCDTEGPGFCVFGYEPGTIVEE